MYKMVLSQRRYIHKALMGILLRDVLNCFIDPRRRFITSGGLQNLPMPDMYCFRSITSLLKQIRIVTLVNQGKEK